MIQSINIGKYVYKVLTESADLTKLVSNRVYPMVANVENIKFPFVVFSRTNLQAQYTKDYNTEDIVDISVICCSNNYPNSVDVATAVRKAMYRLHKYSDDNITICQCRLENVYETYDSDTYMQQLDFRLSII